MKHTQSYPPNPSFRVLIKLLVERWPSSSISPLYWEHLDDLLSISSFTFLWFYASTLSLIGTTIAFQLRGDLDGLPFMHVALVERSSLQRSPLNLGEPRRPTLNVFSHVFVILWIAFLNCHRARWRPSFSTRPAMPFSISRGTVIS